MLQFHGRFNERSFPFSSLATSMCLNFRHNPCLPRPHHHIMLQFQNRFNKRSFPSKSLTNTSTRFLYTNDPCNSSVDHFLACINKQPAKRRTPQPRFPISITIHPPHPKNSNVPTYSSTTLKRLSQSLYHEQTLTFCYNLTAAFMNAAFLPRPH